MQKGKLSVHTGNILPVIKKWLYSEKEIFLREMVSNAVDAISKLRKVTLTEEVFQAENDDYAVDIHIDRENNALVFEDNGVGLTEEEVKKYITQIAFSGAEEFIKKYEDAADKKAGIIGNFGLGFYSSFMVASRVEINSRSYIPAAKAVFWSSDGEEDYEIGEGSREKRGTEIRLILEEEDASEYLDKGKVSDLVRKYCDFMPFPVRVDGSQVNRQKPLWMESPSALKKEDYIEFYKYLYPYQGDPLFYIHLNVEHPFELKGILYFPKLAHELDLNRSDIKIYCRQVFVTDEAQEIIPQFLTVLQGVVDMPDLPLNVSRSYIQNEPIVRKVSSHIVKKVADRLNEEFKTNRSEYEQIWNEIGPFVKFGMMHDDKFYEQASPSLLFEVIPAAGEEKRFCTLDEYIVKNKPVTGDRVFYASDVKSQGQAVRLLQKQGIEVLLLGSMIDSHFTGFLEGKHQEIRLLRVDSELSEHVLENDDSSSVVDPENKDRDDRIREAFQKAIGNEKVTVRIEKLKTEEIPAMIMLPEHLRRFSEMSVFMGQEKKFPDEHTLLVNSGHPVIQRIGQPSLITGGDGAGLSKTEKLALQVYRLARLSHGAMNAEEVETYVADTYNLLAES